MKILALFFPIAALFVPPVFAAQVQYTINFTLADGYSPLPASGYFTYDAGAGFSNFLVHWEDAQFDLSSAANNPTVSDPATGCAPAGGGPAYAYQIMTQTATGCTATYSWAGSYIGFIGFAQFGFSLDVLAYPSRSDAFVGGTASVLDTSINNFAAVGSWSITEGAPEPGTLGMMLLGAMAVAAVRRATRVR